LVVFGRFCSAFRSIFDCFHEIFGLVTPIEKAETALNCRIERIQANLREARSEAERQIQFQSLIVAIGVGEVLKDYIKTIGEYARGRHAELKQANDSLTVRHAQVLQSGNELLERFKGNPRDPGLRKEIELAQREMAAIQKTLRRGADSLRRDVAPSLGMIDELALTARRFGEADGIDALKRTTKLFLGHVRQLYRTQPTLPAKDIIDAAAWEISALTEVDQAAEFHAAYARAGFQAILAVELMSMAVSPAPPATAEEATDRANRAAAARLTQIATRLSAVYARRLRSRFG
jgi:hypothetical protein